MIVLAASACSPSLPAQSPTPPPDTSTPDLGRTATAQVMTAIAGFSATPSYTPTVTQTPYPTITPIPSPTSLQSSTPAPLSTLGDGSAGGTPGTPGTPGTSGPPPTVPYACTLVSKLPTDWSILKPGDTFSASWKIKNSGMNTWKFGHVVLIFISGNKLQRNKNKTVYDIPADVLPGTSTTLVLDMLAPNKPSNYISSWGLQFTNTKAVFCDFSVRITVAK